VELKLPLQAMLIDQGVVSATDTLEPGTRVELGEPAGVSAATGEELVDLYVVAADGRRLHYRAHAREVAVATGTAGAS
jgi:hypothetical protein